MKMLVVFVLALCLLLSLPVVIGQITATITDSLEPDQANDIRLGVLVVNSRSRYSAGAASNLLGPGEFEDFSSGKAIEWQTFEFNGQWGASTPNGVTYSQDTTTGNFVHGKSSQKIQVNVGSALPFSFGQYQSKKEFQGNSTYEFACYLKQEGMSQNPKLRVRYRCPSGVVDQSQQVSVTAQWQRHAFRFTMPVNCKPVDPRDGQGSSSRIDVYSPGTLWIDSCELFDVTDQTDWGLSERFINAVKKIRPATLRWGGLTANPVKKENILLSNRFDAQTYENAQGAVEGSVTLSLNQFLKLNELVGSNPLYVISQRFSVSDNEDFLEYLFGNSDSEYGAKRAADGYPAWANKFDNWYFELGNELLCCPDTTCFPLAPGLPLCAGENSGLPPAYADWSTPRINLYKGALNPEAGKTKVGFNVWTAIGRPYQAKETFEQEKANAGGGNSDFFLVQSYYNGPDNPTDYFKRVFGQGAFAEAEDRYHDAMSQKFYGRQLPWGYYEYGASNYTASGTAQYNNETSLGYGLSMLDQSINLRKKGAIILSAFYLNGLGYSWGFMDNYPVIEKRPVYYLYELYGTFARGQFVSHSLSGSISTWDPFGANPSQTIPSSSYASKGYPIEPYPENVPYIVVYPFKQNNRYSIVIINRSLTDTIPVSLNLPYAPSAKAQLHFVSANSASEKNVQIQHQDISDFANGYTLQIKPFSAYAIVNYMQGTSACLDEDNDGYGANSFELENCSGSTTLADCDDFNPNIRSGNSNSYCDCDKANNGYYIGGLEKQDGIDNDCDGAVDSGVPSDCVDMPRLLDFISQWKFGSIDMLVLLQKIASWKSGTGCP